MAGRSFNDLMQYPVFPFVLSDYESSVLDLSKKSVFRNFKKPMAIQEKRNEQHYINNYNVYIFKTCLLKCMQLLKKLKIKRTISGTSKRPETGSSK